MIHCAIGFQNRGDFYQSAYVTVLSCFKNTTSPLHLHMVIDETVDPYTHYFQDLCDEYGHSLSLYKAPPLPEDVLATFPGNALAHYTPASLFRLYLHEFIDADTLIYFDCDIIFERDIADWHGHAVGDAYAVATHDPSRQWSYRKKRYYLRALGIDENRYFNSGVLTLNLKKIRADSAHGNIFWKAYRDMAPLAAKLSFPVYDQDLLNAMLSGDKEKLLLADPSFNYELCLHDRRFYPPERLKGHILHFAALKPWGKFFPAHLHYWKYHALSPWKAQTFDLISQRFFDKNDSRTQALMRVWKHPGWFEWLNKF